MSVNEKIKTALLPFGYEVVPDVYLGDDQTYFVFNYDTVPDNFGDDMPQHERVLIQVHLYAPHEQNTVQLRTGIKQCLYEAGFGWPSITDAAERKYQHWVFECEDVEEIYFDG